MIIKGKAYIDGKFISKKEVVAIISPLDNKVIGTVPALNKGEINHGFTSANKAFKEWSQTDYKRRIKYVNLFTKQLIQNKKKIAQIMYQEIAKPIEQGIIEIVRTIEYIDKTILAYEKIREKVVKINHKNNTIYRVPLGVILAISPFNYPINLSLAKIIPALITGNTIVFKPSTNGSLVGSYLAKMFDNANLPAGVFNLVTGKGQDIGNILTTNKLIKMISFTGSVKTGQLIASHHALIPLILELGGNDSAYIRHDANIKLAAKKVAKGAFDFAGQRCTAIKRLIVHEQIKNHFLDELKIAAKEILPLPLINKQAADWVSQLLNDKHNHIILGGLRKGNQFSNTIVETSTKSLAWTEEAFGPLLPIVYVKDDKTALEIMNDTHYGLQNSLFTNNITWAKKVALNIESGSVNINGASSRGPDEFPFLGVKDSGFGTQGIEEALLSMTRYLNVVNNE